MTSETVSAMSPDQVILAAKEFFTGARSPHPATVIEEGAGHLTVATFRSRVAISAWPDTEGRGTRVRISTLRGNDAIGKLLTILSNRKAGGADGDAEGA